MTTIGAGLPLSHISFTAPPLHIPDGHGGCYKTELVIERSEEQTIKINWWHGSDPRLEPHTHPWNFTTTIIAGGYTEIRFKIENGKVYKIMYTVRAGDMLNVQSNEYHLITDVLQGTVTQMTCGRLQNVGEWRLMNPETGETWVSTPEPNFRANLVKLNPHLVK